MEKLVIIGTHAEDDPEKATLVWVMACTATASEMEPVVVLQGMGVYMARKNYAAGIRVPSFPPVDELIEAFQESKGKLLVCAPCLNKRNLGQEDLLEGATIINAPTVIKEIGEATQVITY
ncbi:MAG: DsrE family protein [Methanomassiliicoccales archaeon]